MINTQHLLQTVAHNPCLLNLTLLPPLPSPPTLLATKQPNPPPTPTTPPLFNIIHQPDQAFLASNKVATTDWIINSGATMHMTGNKSLFTSLTPTTGIGVEMANKQIVSADGKGEINLILGHLQTATLKNVLFVPGLTKNLFSVSAATRNDNISIIMKRDKCLILDKQHLVVQGLRTSSLYTIHAIPNIPAANIASTTQIWHQRLGHI
eukprot:Phypoly_transcript_15265.p1 GENE.Phypoly_transcript_15265~~Phypoly_transcript_15265.p1  ORF type:complete len:208 (-),score=35.50 Phypoly_transcript_15265:37-660(-)